jgi:hypothetical protein
MAEPEPPTGRKLTRAEKAELNRAAWTVRQSPPSTRVLTGTLTRVQMQALRQEAWRLRHVSTTPLNLPPDFLMPDAVAAMLGLSPNGRDRPEEPSDDE